MPEVTLPAPGARNRSGTGGGAARRPDGGRRPAASGSSSKSRARRNATASACEPYAASRSPETTRPGRGSVRAYALDATSPQPADGRLRVDVDAGASDVGLAVRYESAGRARAPEPGLSVDASELRCLDLCRRHREANRRADRADAQAGRRRTRKSGEAILHVLAQPRARNRHRPGRLTSSDAGGSIASAPDGHATTSS
jgi:hypothetical protein